MRVSSTVLAVALFAAPAAASAQVYVVAQPAPAPAPAPQVFMPRTYYPVVHRTPVQLERRWGIGLRASHGALTSEARPDDPLEIGGGGLDLRWRASKHWSFDLAASGWHAKSEEGAYERSLGLMTIGTALHLTPRSRWDLYLSFGVGGGETEVTYLNAGRQQITEKADVGTVRLGAGAEYRFRNGLAIGLEGRVGGVVRSDEDEPPIPEDQDLRAIPHSNGQATLDMTLTYYF